MPAGSARGGGSETFVVTTNEDPGAIGCNPGDCSLREAIIAANANPFADTIKFDPFVFPPDPPYTKIQVQAALDFVDATDGITIDATGTPTEIVPCTFEGCDILWGLVFVTPLGTTAHNITVRHVSLTGFMYDALQVCGGVNHVTQTCDSDVNNVTIEDGVYLYNTHDAIRIFGDHISNVTLADITAENSGEDGIRFQGASSVSSVTVSGGLDIYNSQNGIQFSGDSLSGLNVQNVGTANNGGNGYWVNATGSVSGLTMQNLGAGMNNGSGIEVDAMDIEGVTITGATISDSGLNNIHVFAGGTLRNVTIQGGQSTGGYGISLGERAGAKNVIVSNNTVTDSKGDGVSIGGRGNIEDLTLSGNTISGSQGAGINVGPFDPTAHTSSLKNAVIEGNNVESSVGAGILVLGSDPDSGNVVHANTVEGGQASGIVITNADPTVPDSRVTISRNITDNNSGLGINLVSAADDSPNAVTPNDPGDGDTGPNGLLNFPVITGATGQAVTGTACANCVVELFLADGDSSGHGEGETFLNDATAGGNAAFSVSICSLPVPAGSFQLTATATDPAGNSSEFAQNFESNSGSDACQSPTPTGISGQRKQGDLDCNGQINGKDGLLSVQFAAGISIITPGGCLPLGLGNPQFGDVTCNGTIDGHDTVAILEFAAHVAIKPTPVGGCTPLGEALS